MYFRLYQSKLFAIHKVQYYYYYYYRNILLYSVYRNRPYNIIQNGSQTDTYNIIKIIIIIIIDMRYIRAVHL